MTDSSHGDPQRRALRQDEAERLVEGIADLDVRDVVGACLNQAAIRLLRTNSGYPGLPAECVPGADIDLLFIAALARDVLLDKGFLRRVVRGEVRGD